MIKRAKKVVSDIACFLERHSRLVIVCAMAAYFFRGLLQGLLKGGRWDLYQNIAMADRFLNGQGFYYSPIEASSPYFPGVAFLAVLVGKCFYPWRDYILLVIASMIGTAFLYALIKLGERFSQTRELSLVVTFALVSIGFGNYRNYMNEFKADSLVLLFAVLLILVIDKVENDEHRAGIGTALVLFGLAFIMDVTKQHALYIDVALGFYLLFTRKLSIREKIVILGSLVAAGLVDLAVLFSIPGMELQAIRNLSDMPYWDISTIIRMMWAVVKEHIPYFLLLFSFIYFFLKKRIHLDALAGKWFLVAFAFGVGQIAGGWKRGGNAGNYEAGMVAFMPYVVVSASYIYREYFKNTKKSVMIGAMNYATCAICLVMLAQAGSKTDELARKIQTDREVSAYLSQTFGSETIMYDSNYYMEIVRSTVEPGMDVNTVPKFIKEYMHTMEEALRDQTYQYVYVRPERFESWDTLLKTYCDEETDALGMFEKNYEVMEDPAMPENLKGKLFIAK